jgi:hypothetical protein
MVNTPFILDIVNSCNVYAGDKRIFSNYPKLIVSTSLLLYLLLNNRTKTDSFALFKCVCWNKIGIFNGFQGPML